MRLQISFDVIGFEELAFLILRFVLALAFCDLAFLLRPSLLYQRSVKRRHHLGLPNVSMRNSALVGWWWGCGRSLAKLEVPLLNFLPFCPVGHSLQFTGNVYFFRMMTFQFGCLGFSVFELAVAFQCVEFFSVAASFSMC